MNVGHVENGTQAGWRRVKQKHPRWTCCRDNPGWRGRCERCGAKRPT